ncbi:hypothetical protein B0O80DRAFT_141124 [Mortierella sp. GBAus27b]|nr:hypothetical protein B0O80DRAFT_141124 [Mortierella sp. GBAus27b]
MIIEPPVDTPIYNILLLGPTQSGKSTFFEFVRKYADPLYTINEECTGTGNWTCTQDVRSEEVVTNLPIYKLFDLDNSDDDWDVSAGGEREIDIDAALSQSNVKPFKKLLERDENLEVRPEATPSSEWARYNLIDTPGLDDTSGHDMRNLAKIFKALSTIDKFHLVLILDSHNKTFSTSVVEAFKTYFHLFKELDNLTMVLHTHASNIERHPSKTKFAQKLAERSRFFDEIAGREIPTKRIDCDLDASPANTCLTWNTIRELLEIARLKTPGTRNKTHVRKTPKMTAVDQLLRQRCQEKLDATRESCKNLDKIDLLSIKIEEIERQRSASVMAVKTYDTDELASLFEYNLDESWTFLGRIKEHKADFPEQEFTITKKAVAQKSMNELDQHGGEGEKYWQTRFYRTSYQSGYYYVVLSTTSRIKYKKEIMNWNATIDLLDKTVKDLKERITDMEGTVQRLANRTDTPTATEELKFKLSMYGMILDHAKSDTIPMGLFLGLANADMYLDSGDTKCAEVLEHHFEKLFKESPKLLLQGSWIEHFSKPA